uniref:Putative tail protein n=1 Tax=viral metagenome TaxID=1070528 RepID=A0A6M3J2T8_9ZZZZ
MSNCVIKNIPEPQNLETRNKILAFEEKLKTVPGAMLGDCCPLKHTFVDGAYVREITMPKGMLLTSKIHKICHPYFILKGDVSVLTEEGVVRIKAPYYGITKPGTKRVLFMHEETIWVTIHVTKETDLVRIEKEIIAASYDDVPSFNGLQKIDVLKIMEGKETLCLG